MTPITTPQVRSVAALHREGHTHAEIAAKLALSKDQVNYRVCRARELGMLSPRRCWSDQRRERLHILREGYNMRTGAFSDILTALDPDQFRWLLDVAEKDKRQTLAEHLTYLIRAEYERKVELTDNIDAEKR